MNEIVAKKESSTTEAQPVFRISFLSRLAQRFLKKIELGEMTIKHIAWWLNLTKAERDEYMVNGKKFNPKIVPLIETELLTMQKFTECDDLGVVTVPYVYDHGKCIGLFRKRNKDQFPVFNDAITDKVYAHLVTTLRPGAKFQVKVYRQIDPVPTTSSEERIAFLGEINAMFAGPQGLTLVWEQKKHLLKKYFWYQSFDKEKGSTVINVGENGIFNFSLSGGNTLRGDELFLGFHPIEISGEESSIL